MIHCAQKQLSQSGVKKEEKKEEVMNLNEGVVDKIKKKTCCWWVNILIFHSFSIFRGLNNTD